MLKRWLARLQEKDKKIRKRKKKTSALFEGVNNAYCVLFITSSSLSVSFSATLRANTNKIHDKCSCFCSFVVDVVITKSLYSVQEIIFMVICNFVSVDFFFFSCLEEWGGQLFVVSGESIFFFYLIRWLWYSVTSFPLDSIFTSALFYRKRTHFLCTDTRNRIFALLISYNHLKSILSHWNNIIDCFETDGNKMLHT